MNYAQIKRELREAADLVDAGDVAGADAKIRALVGHGLTLVDVDDNLTRAQRQKLREFARAKSEEASMTVAYTSPSHGGFARCTSESSLGLRCMRVHGHAGSHSARNVEWISPPRVVDGYREPSTVKHSEGCTTCGKLTKSEKMGPDCGCGAHGCRDCGTGEGLCTMHGREQYARMIEGAT